METDPYDLEAERLRELYSKEEYFNQPEGFPFFKEGDFNLDEVMLPPEEDFGI